MPHIVSKTKAVACTLIPKSSKAKSSDNNGRKRNPPSKKESNTQNINPINHVDIQIIRASSIHFIIISATIVIDEGILRS